ncbi:MAG: transcriptional repressor [Candidatus Omnitrophica bacterium]|nr:transcriptional repressor [Candidatus Omnitrophota bacterium]
MPGRNGRGRIGGRKWQGMVRGCGYRLTIPRRAVMEVLSSTDEHLSAEEVYHRVHDQYPAVGLTTIYRTLELLFGLGLVSRLDFGDGRARYELSAGSPKGHHHHLICTKCRKVIDYTEFIKDELEFLERAEKGLAEKYDFEIRDHVIQFRGLCKDCKDRNNK